MSDKIQNPPAAWNEMARLEENLMLSKGLIFLLARSVASTQTTPPASKDGDAVHGLADHITALVDESYNAAFAATWNAFNPPANANP